MTHDELIHVLETVGDAAYRIFSETFKVFADYNKQKNAEIRHLRTMIADHEDSDVSLGEAYGKTRDRLTNIEWLYRHPEELAALIYCPMPSPTCPHEEEVASTDDDDVCHRCLLDWLKEEHKDD